MRIIIIIISLFFPYSASANDALPEKPVSKNDVLVAKILLEKGTGGNELHDAVYNKDFTKVKQLIAQGKDIESRNSRGRTVLQKALMHKTKISMIQIVRKIIDNPDALTERSLKEMVGNDNYEVVKYLLDNGADINARDSHNWTPLHVAARYSTSPRIVKMLIDKGAKLEALNQHGNTPLHAAAGNPISAKILLNTGVNIEAKDIHGNTALYWAASFSKNIEIFIKAGADVNVQNKNNNTPLHAVATRGTAVGAKLLLDAGADIGIKNRQELTALELAKKSNNIKVVKYLENRIKENRD